MARTLMVSTLTRSQSSWPWAPRRSKTRRCRASNTPASAHSVSRRQQVDGEPQPSSRAGSSRHGVEVRAMKTIAAKQARSEMVRYRPPYGGRGGAGSKGSTNSHSWSGTRSSARLVMAPDPARPTPKERNDVLTWSTPRLRLFAVSLYRALGIGLRPKAIGSPGDTPQVGSRGLVGGRSHSDALVGATVWSTTPSSSASRASRSS